MKQRRYVVMLFRDGKRTYTHSNVIGSKVARICATAILIKYQPIIIDSSDAEKLEKKFGILKLHQMSVDEMVLAIRSISLSGEIEAAATIAEGK